MKFERKEILINGRKTFYWEKNPEQKETIVLLHGFPGNHEGLLKMADGFKGYHLIIPDLPACGLSEPLAKKHNLENYSSWLNEFFKNLLINRAVVAGHSFGARTALVFCEKYPEKVEKLVLITPVVKVEGLIARFVAAEYEIAKFLPKYLQKSWLSNGFHQKVGHMIIFKTSSKKRRQELIAKEEREVKHLNPQINIELFDEFYKVSLIPLGKKIKTKSLVIAGELDEIAPLDSVRELAGQLENSDFIIMKKCGHIVVGEEPLATARIIRKWLEK